MKKTIPYFVSFIVNQIRFCSCVVDVPTPVSLDFTMENILVAIREKTPFHSQFEEITILNFQPLENHVNPLVEASLKVIGTFPVIIGIIEAIGTHEYYTRDLRYQEALDVLRKSLLPFLVTPPGDL